MTMLKNDVARSRAALAKGSKSFALAGKLLPASVRDDAAVVYAFCRRADDLVDEPTDTTAVAAAVTQLSDEIARIYAGAPQTDSVLRAFQDVALRRAIPRAVVEDLIAGFAMDARPTPQRYETWQELLLYSYRVAGTVGLMMCQVMGTRDSRAHQHAAALGMGMQLTNIARDVAEDWARGRLYIPREALHAVNVDAEPLVPGTHFSSDVAVALSRALPALLDAADPLYRWGDAGLVYLYAPCAVGVRAARLIYSDIGRVLRRRRCDVAAGRAVVSGPRKLWLVARAAGDIAVARISGRQGGGTQRLPPLPAAFPQLPSPGGVT